MAEHAATFDDASFDDVRFADAARDERTVRRGFWVKVKRFGAGLPFAEDLLAAYYCAFDRDTPLQVKAPSGRSPISCSPSTPSPTCCR